MTTEAIVLTVRDNGVHKTPHGTMRVWLVNPNETTKEFMDGISMWRGPDVEERHGDDLHLSYELETDVYNDEFLFRVGMEMYTSADVERRVL